MVIKPKWEGFLTDDISEFLSVVRQQAAAHISDPLDVHFTDHGFEHCKRVMLRIGEILQKRPVVDGRPLDQQLNEIEQKVVGAAVYLHDVGMFYSKGQYAEDDKSRRKEHHDISRDWILGELRDGSLNNWQTLGLAALRDEQLLDYVATVAWGHRDVSLSRPEFETERCGNSDMRLRLLAGLLRLADGLDIDFQRVRAARRRYQDVPQENLGHWLRHHYVKAVVIDNDGYVQAHLSLPKAYPRNEELSRLVIALVEGEIRTAIDETADALHRFRIALRLKAASPCERADVDRPEDAGMDALQALAREKLKGIPAQMRAPNEPQGTGVAVEDMSLERPVATGTPLSLETQGNMHDAQPPGAGAHTQDHEMAAVRPTARLRSILGIRQMGLRSPADGQDASEFLKRVVGLDVATFWLLEYARTARWLECLSGPLEDLVRRAYGSLHHPTMRLLTHVANQDRQAVVTSPLLAALWHSAHQMAPAYASYTIAHIGAWEDPCVRQLLDEAGGLGSGQLQLMACHIADYGAESPHNAEFAMSYLVPWFIDADAGARTSVLQPAYWSLSDSIQRVAEQQPEAVLMHGGALVDAWLDGADCDITSLAFALGSDVEMGDPAERMVILITKLMVSGLRTTPPSRAAAETLRQLAADPLPAKQLMALKVVADVIVDAGHPVTEVGLILVDNPANLVSWHGEYACHIIHELFAILDDEQAAALSVTLLGVPATLGDGTRVGAVKHEVLTAIPADRRSEPVRRELHRLRETQGFEDDETPPSRPLHGVCVEIGRQDESVSFADVLDDPQSTVRRLIGLSKVVGEDLWGEESVSGSDALHAELEHQPEAIVPLARAIADAGRAVHVGHVEAVCRALAAPGVSGEDVVRVSSCLDEFGSQVSRQYCAWEISKRWEQLGPGEQVTAVQLLVKWADPEMTPDPTPEWAEDWMARPNTGDAATIGLNTPRGAMAVALIQGVRHLQPGIAREAALDRIAALCSDNAAPVRAVTLTWLRSIAAVVDSEWLVEAVRAATGAFHPEVAPHAEMLLYRLGLDEVRQFGLELARSMLKSQTPKGHDAAGKLGAFWSLRHDEASIEGFVDGVLAGENARAKSASAEVFARNLIAEDERVSEKCRNRCLQVLRTQPPDVRAIIVQTIPRGDELPASPQVSDVLRTVAQDDSPDVVRGLWRMFRAGRRGGSQLHAEIVKAVVEGLVANNAERTQRQFLYESSRDVLCDAYRILRAAGAHELALDLLDCACYHCVPEAKELLDELAGELGKAKETK